PKKSLRITAAAALKVLCPETYDGNAGVVNRGVQPVSAAVFGLPSPAAVRTAVIGRQNRSAYLASQAAMALSAMAMFSAANRRASSASVSWRPAATCPTISFQWPGGVSVPPPSAQNRAI